MGLIKLLSNGANPVRVIDGDGLSNRRVTRLSLNAGDSDS